MTSHYDRSELEQVFPRSYGASVFAHDRPSESERLSLMEEEQDPYTISRIEALGIAANWDCLEVGAGKGSMVAWLADRCTTGHVTAVDLDVSLIDLQERENIEIIQMDIAKDSFPAGSFDLIHARSILTHLADPQTVCNRMAQWLRPGGWLFVADPASFPVDSSPHLLMRKIGLASTEVISQMVGTDPNWARTYPNPLLQAGLVQVDAECRLQLMRGGSREARLFELMLGQIEEPLRSTGIVSAKELDELRLLLLDPTFVDFPPAFVRAWGRRPVI